MSWRRAVERAEAGRGRGHVGAVPRHLVGDIGARARCWQLLHHTISRILAASAWPRVIGADSPSLLFRLIIPTMPRDLTDDDKAILAELLRETIAADRFPLSPKIKRLKVILATLAPPAPRPEPMPPPKPSSERSVVLAKKHRR
jgi:hypothetical protein